jgi:diguanylate cyclase (GGDEF)-like protein/putative nucleotidyltransferase with HDIG domain
MDSLKKIFDLADYDAKTKVIWWTYFVVALPMFIGASTGLVSFSLSQVSFLFFTLGIVIVGKNLLFRIPQTNIILWLRETVILLSFIWVGTPGALIIGSLTTYTLSNQITKSYRRNFVGTTSVVITTFITGLFFTFAVNAFGEQQYLTTTSFSLPYLFILLFSTAILHYLINTILCIIFLAFRDERNVFDIWKEYFAPGLVTYGVGLLIAFTINIFFIQFGMAVGFLFIPFVFLMNLANRFYRQTLHVKTEESSEKTRIYSATIEALATAIDARDQVGIGHARRVQIYALGMGEVLGLTDDEMQALHIGALLHDIGKLAVPDHILNKPGRLTPAELEKTKIHASVGASILEKVNFPYPVVPTVLYHHENWDGSGYPKGLSKEDIPITARIVAVADAYDTLRGARPYRSSLSREEARRYLLNSSGKQFDPRLVDVLLRNWHNFEKEIDAEGLSYAFENNEKSSNNNLVNEFQITNNKNGYVEQIKRANREVYTLYELARVFSGSLSLDETLKLFVEKVKELVPFDTCVIYLYDESEKTAVATYSEGLNASSLENKRIKEGEGATGYVLKNRQSVHNINPVLDFSFSYSHIAENFVSMASVPLIANERLIGAISLYSCELESYEDDYMRLLETITRIAADAISKSVTYAENENRASTDPMTGLPNARTLQTHFEHEIARSRRTGNNLQILMLDLDGFKAVNDTFGHKIGDKVLRGVSQVIKEQLRDYDFLARYAGDEFVAIIPEMTEEDVREVCNRIEKSVSNFKIPAGDSFAKVGISIGSSSYPQNGESLDQLIVVADQTMYTVKATHKLKEKEQEAKQLEEMQIKALEGAVRVMPEEFIIGDDAVIFDIDDSHIVSNSLN